MDNSINELKEKNNGCEKYFIIKEIQGYGTIIKKWNGTAMIYNNNGNWNKDKFEGEGFN